MGRKQQVLPIFPLANVSLFPGVLGLFHIFEPRYRQMTEQALAGDRRIGMAAVLPDSSGAMAADPPVFAVACAGEIRESQRLDDSRFHLALLGSNRVRIVEELERPPGRLYRVAVVEELEDTYDAHEAGRVAAMRSQIGELVGALIGDTRPGGEQAFEPERFAALDDATFVNGLCKDLPFPVLEKQSLLEADGIPARYERLIEVLDFALAAAEAREVPNSGGVH